LGLQLRRRRARQCRRDEHRGQVDVREVLDLHRPEAQQAEHRQEDEEQQRRDRIADRPGGEVHRLPTYLMLCATATVSPSARKPTPLSTTASSGPRPLVISMRSPSRRPVSTFDSFTWLSASSLKSQEKPSRTITLEAGTVSALLWPRLKRPLANMPA